MNKINGTEAVTIIESTSPEVVAKQYTRKGNQVEKTAVASITKGVAWTESVETAEQMVALLRIVTEATNQVICPGTFLNSGINEFNITSEGELAKLLNSKPGEVKGGVVEHNGNRVAARLKRGIEQSSWVLIDCDNPPGIPAEWAAMDIQGRLEFLEPIAQGISTCERIELRSSSNRVLKDGQASKPASHAWVRVSDPSKVALLKAHVGVKMVTEGLCFNFEKKSRLDREKTVGIEARTVVDLAVWDTGRLVFCSKPILGKGMEHFWVDDAGITIVNPGAGAWDIGFAAVPTKAALTDYKAKTGIELKVSKSNSGLSMDNFGQLTLETEIERRGVIKPLADWLEGMEPDTTLRCESPFRESNSEAGFISKHGNGKVILHDVGNGVSYHLMAKKLELTASVGDEPHANGVGAHLSAKQLEALGEVVAALPLSKDGRIVPSYTSMVNVINHLGLSYDQFLDTAMILVNGKLTRFEDSHYVDVAMKLEEIGFAKVPAYVKDCVRKCMMLKQFDSAQDWLKSLKWDGIDRCNALMPTYFGSVDSEYTRAVSAYIVTAMAGRIIEPGCKADMVPILVGAQGIGKTTGVKALSPMIDTFTEIDLGAKGDANLSRQMRGKLIGELGELRGLKTREAEFIKAWITRTHEEWTPKWCEFTKSMPRRCVFFGTTNDSEFLVDTTGNRRWLPIDVEGFCDVEAIVNDRDQIWAQAAAMFHEHGVMWQKAERLATAIHGDYMVVDEAYVGFVEDALANNPDAFTKPFKANLMLKAIFGDATKPNKKNRDDVCAAMRSLGFDNKVIDVGGKKVRSWIPPNFNKE